MMDSQENTLLKGKMEEVNRSEQSVSSEESPLTGEKATTEEQSADHQS